MSKIAISVVALSILAALGIGAYQTGGLSGKQPLPDPYSNSQPAPAQASSQPVPAQARVPDTLPVAPPADSPPNYSTSLPTPTAAAQPPTSINTTTPARTGVLHSGQTSVLLPEYPKTASVTQSTTTVTEQGNPAGVQKTTVTEKKSVVYNHPVYARRIVHHRRKSDKVHVARAAKHLTLFTAKLPGRLRL